MFPLIVMLAVLAQDAAAAPEAPVDAPRVLETVDKSLAFLAEKGLAWETTKCVSCHHGPWMMWSGYEAKMRGFVVNDESLEKVVVTALKAYSTHPQLQPTNRDVLNDLSINAMYLTFGMGAAGQPDAETEKFFDKAAAHLIEQQKEEGSWKVLIKKTTPEGVSTTFLMPPLIDSDDVTTLWALLTLNYRVPSGISKEALDNCKERGLKFLGDNPPSDTLQSLVFRIMLNQRLNNADAVPALVQQLFTLQKDDGGWSQTTKKPHTDALGTGQALVALTTAGVTTKDPAVAKARAYLIKNQKPDGSWFVVSRAYEPPEFSSYIGTAWATLGLVRTLPENKDAAGVSSTRQLTPLNPVTRK